VDRGAGPGRLRPSLNPVEQITEDYRRWASGELNPDGALDDRGVPAAYPLPEHGIDFELAEAFGWTWEQVQATPLLIRRLWFQFLMVRRVIEAERSERQQAATPPTDQDRRGAQDEIAAAQAAVAAQEARGG